MNRNKFLVVGFFLASVVASANTSMVVDCSKESSYPEISKTDLQAKLNEKAVFVIDVNGKSSFAEKHIPTAIHFAANEKAIATVLPADKNALIVAYCGGPQCGAWKKAAQSACKQGYTNVQHFKGGLSGWFKG